MKLMKWSVMALAVAAGTSQIAIAGQQSEAQGFVEGAKADLLLRNAYFLRDHGDRVKDQSRWGQGFIATFESGFTQGTVGVGVDAYGLLGVKLDTGKSRNDGGIGFFATDSDGDAQKDVSEAGAAIKFRVSSSVLKYGNQLPSLPVLSHDTTRLLPQTFTGTLLTSNEIDGLEVNAGRFTSQNDKNTAGWDSSNSLKSIDVIGGSYAFNDNLSAALYYSDIEDVAEKKYANLAYVLPLADQQSLGFDFNIYKTDYKKGFVESYTTDVDNGIPGVRESRSNTIWSLAAKYSVGAHAFILAHQRNTGDEGYKYDIGDGGNAIYLANSFLSDFNSKDERSWQASYELDFSGYGVPGLFWKSAYIRGSNIDRGADRSAGSEREFFNQVSYVIQDGPAKDLSFKVRNSILKTSNGYWNDMNEVRVFVEYPLSIL
ncbi:outer membrane porin, OprD family [Stutzerimonas kirkiae]|uniref:Outer membrane porin, OprD family n=1 Tax=Stutzerimonas kirkiae TaxID=2211392 RepID=A0A4Q9RDZ5_9GAMM|nr:OprD family porin [Stutzerimonas kirkiae]TBU99908.1 outer membrane porin, OprD family [Stutzerimonas kirkiae]TBV05614.1 outer membrane porin, OprD family [Stutzerimonas kirkiae]